jgi:hypothetical protein
MKQYFCALVLVGGLSTSAAGYTETECDNIGNGFSGIAVARDQGMNKNELSG